MTKRKLTKTTKVFEQIRQDILQGHFPPGVKLQMENLKEQYGVGYSPLREALSRLVSHGLVRIEEQCGFAVAPLSLNELYDLYNIRVYIETLALELAIEHGDDQWEADILASWHKYEKYLNRKTDRNLYPAKWDELQKDFLFNLVKACQSPWLLKLRDILYDQADRYRSICLNQNYKNKKMLFDVIDENQRLVSAVLARNKNKALQITKESWQISIKIIAKKLEQQLSVFNKKLSKTKI